MKILFIIIFFVFSCTTKEREFDQGVWKSSYHCKPIKNANLRFEMLQDMKKRVLPGKTIKEVISLLGDQEPQSVLPGVKRDLIYCLGNSKGLSVAWLILRFDRLGRYQSSEVLYRD